MAYPYHIRWMTKKDIDDVATIDAASFDLPWAAPDLLHVLGKANCFGMAAQDEDRNLAGYMIYHFTHREIYLDRFAVAPGHRRRGVGLALVGQLKRKIECLRKRLCVSVPERSLAFQLLLRSCGVPAVRMKDEAIEFEFKFTEPVAEEVA